MSEFRIVFNEYSRRYRIERRGLFGWSFVIDDSGRDYATFASYEEARRFACRSRRRPARADRRWRVVDPCSRPCD